METEKPSPEYLKAYNLGYWFGRLMPETSKQVGQLEGKSDKNIGFQDGKKQAHFEQLLLERSPVQKYKASKDSSDRVRNNPSRSEKDLGKD